MSEDTKAHNSEAGQMAERIGAWEEDGGSIEPIPENTLTGTANQVEWAERIRTQAGAEFDRVSRILETAAREQSPQRQSDTRAMIAILEKRRAAVMANRQAGYFIRDWQELGDQVRKMIVNDAAYQAIKTRSE
jgi:hypothetical protein